MNVINNSDIKNNIKKEDVEIDDVEHSYIGDENKDLVKIFLSLDYGIEISISQNLIIENLT